jgi:hypothetical protein
MTEGKLAVWKLTDPLRPDSLFRGMVGEYALMYGHPMRVDINKVPPVLARLCRPGPTSFPETNPYLTAVQTLVPVLDQRAGQQSRTQILFFTSQMKRPFKRLLHARDPVALLLLSLWYSKAREVVWWLRFRASFECQSISIYLRQYHPVQREILDLLPCGSDEGEGLCG